MADPDFELRRGPVLFSLPSRLFFFQSFLFSPKLGGGGGTLLDLPLYPSCLHHHSHKTVINKFYNLRSKASLIIFCRGGKVRLIQLLEYLSVASPESGLFSDWSRNKKVRRTEP